MLLRLEAHGFKNLVDFTASFGPFTCIAGENAVGKSNVFDAIEFLALIADQQLLDAARAVRSSADGGIGEPEHLFTLGLPERRMRFAVEMVVPASVRDEFGTEVAPTISLLRYEVEIGFRSPDGPNRIGQLVVEREELHHINRGEAQRHLRFPHRVREFRDHVVTGSRRQGAFISTELAEGRITIHQDGGSRGRPKRALPIQATTTVVSTINTADSPTVLAARREMQSWRRLALEPTALRTPDSFLEPRELDATGRHLAGALYRIGTDGPDDADDVYARIANRVAGLAGVDIRSIRVDVDEPRQLLSVIVTDGRGDELPARSLSEGTLRYLALCVLLEDPAATGLIMMEEPENGIHPANLPQMVDLVRDLAVDATLPPGPDNPMRQVIVNTHSPSVVRLVEPDDLLFARRHSVQTESGRVHALLALPMRETWRISPGDVGVSRADLLPYLTEPPGAQISLFPVA